MRRLGLAVGMLGIWAGSLGAQANGVRAAEAKVRAGFAALERARVSGSIADLRTAENAFDDAVHDAPAEANPRFGRALVKLELAVRDAPPKATAGQKLGESNYAAFLRDAEAALARNATFPPLIAFLDSILPPQGDRLQPAAFITALHRASALPGANPVAHLIVGRAWRTAGDDSLALAEFDAYLAGGGDAGIGNLERARTLAGLGRLAEARDAYLAGTREAGAEARRLYREDLEWLATPAELASYDSLGQSPLQAWMERFWSARDAADVRSNGERLGEHLRRWAYVYRHFRVVHPERRTQFERVRVLNIGSCSDGQQKSLDDFSFLHPDRLDDYRRKERILDHRAPIYMRHGEPWARRYPPGASAFADVDLGQASAAAGNETDDGVEPFRPSVLGEGERMNDIHGSEVWLYWFDGAPRVFFFAGGDELGRGRPTTLYAIPPLDVDLMWLLSDLDPSFNRVAARLQTAAMAPSRAVPSSRCFDAVQAMIAHVRGDMQTAVTHDSYTLLFRQPLHAVIQTFAVGRPSAGAGRILAVFAADGAMLVPDPARSKPGRFVYPLTIRVSAIDSVTGIAHLTDTTRTYVTPDSLGPGRYLSGGLEVPVPAGHYRVRVVVFQPNAQAGTSVQRALAALDDASPSLSDIVLGAETDGVRWPNGGDTVTINALGAYRMGGVAPVYYELFGLVPGHEYRTTIELRKYREARKTGAGLVFAETADAPTAHVRRSVSLSHLDRGQYMLSVTVRDSVTGREATREQLINITR